MCIRDRPILFVTVFVVFIVVVLRFFLSFFLSGIPADQNTDFVLIESVDGVNAAEQSVNSTHVSLPRSLGLFPQAKCLKR